MNERIRKLVDKAIDGSLFPEIKSIEYDNEDLFLPDVTMSAKRLCEYMLAQDPVLNDCCLMTGHIRFDGSVEGDVFTRIGHKRFSELSNAFLYQPINNLVSFEWQHATANFSSIIAEGIEGFIERIENSMKNHTGAARLEFLDAAKTVCNGILGWAKKCSDAAASRAEKEGNPKRKTQLKELAKALMCVPRKPAQSMYEAVLCTYFCFSFLPDSIGTVDRYLYPFYRKDINSGKITQDEAKDYIQELFLCLQAHTSPNSAWFTRGGESHFCIGGYTPEGEDGFNELSKLILDALMELPTWIPQISLRWTKKTSFEVLRYVLDCERHDKNKRIAFVSDEPRIKALTEIVGLTFETAANYTMVGCNEPALQGGIYMGSAQENIVRSLINTLYNCSQEAILCENFEEFYQLYERELYKDMAELLVYENKFNYARSKDINILSSLFLDGCIENAKSVTQGGANLAIAGMDLIGITTVIDSLSIIKQFVYEEKSVSMELMLNALNNNWEHYEALHTTILSKGRFFGNNDTLSNGIAKQFMNSIYGYLKGKTDLFGNHYLVGNLNGYIQYNKWFGEKTKATPDGRYSGDMISFGIGQSDGKDREGLTALLSSIAQADEHAILSGPSVTNVLLDEKLIKDDAHFEKTAILLETYFKMGGLHFQLLYLSKKDLKSAKISPDKYKGLRVRVSGFSDYFVALNEDIQDEIITRTQIGG